MSPSPEPSRADCVTADVKRRVDRCDMLNKSLRRRSVPNRSTGREATHFAYRIDRWDASDSIVEHVAGIDDLAVARAAYEAACKRWPGDAVTLRQGARIIEDSRKTRLA